MIVDDADAVYARAKEAGAEIVIAIEDKPYGGRGFTCRDLEGKTVACGDVRSVGEVRAISYLLSAISYQPDTGPFAAEGGG